jgi:hypothetical protein
MAIHIDSSSLLLYYAPDIDAYELRLPPASLNDPNICKNTLSKLASPEFKAALSSAIDSVQKGESKFVVDQKELSSAYNSYLDALVKQGAKLQEKLSSSQSAFQIGSNLWALLLILAFAAWLRFLALVLSLVKIYKWNGLRLDKLFSS